MGKWAGIEQGMVLWGRSSCAQVFNLMGAEGSGGAERSGRCQREGICGRKMLAGFWPFVSQDMVQSLIRPFYNGEGQNLAADIGCTFRVKCMSRGIPTWSP
eukprot:scaffold92298_cov21-Tisochrysis_lutea.AAC.1